MSSNDKLFDFQVTRFPLAAAKIVLKLHDDEAFRNHVNESSEPYNAMIYDSGLADGIDLNNGPEVTQLAYMLECLLLDDPDEVLG